MACEALPDTSTVVVSNGPPELPFEPEDPIPNRPANGLLSPYNSFRAEPKALLITLEPIVDKKFFIAEDALVIIGLFFTLSSILPNIPPLEPLDVLVAGTLAFALFWSSLLLVSVSGLLTFFSDASCSLILSWAIW